MERRQRETIGVTGGLFLAAVWIFAACPLALAQYDPNHFDPDNAAHWYMKAFELYDQQFDKYELRGYFTDDENATEVEQYLEEQQELINLIVKACQMEHCDWLYDIDDPNNWWPRYYDELTYAQSVLLADGRHHEKKKEFSVLFERLDQVLLLSEHTFGGNSADFISYISFCSTSFRIANDFLNRNPDCSIEDLETLKDILVRHSNQKHLTYTDLLKRQVEEAKIYLSDPELLPQIYREFVTILNPAENSVHQEFYKKNLEYYQDYTSQFIEASELPYPQAYEKITQIVNGLKTKRSLITSRFTGTPDQYKATQEDSDYTQQYDFVYTLVVDINPMLNSTNQSLYQIDILYRNYLNTLITATTLLIEYKNTQKLPDTLGEEYPIDLLKNKPFQFTKTDESFTLKYIDKHYNRDYDYKFNLRYDPDWDKKEKQNPYTPDNAAYWYKEASSLISFPALDDDSKDLLKRLVQKETGAIVDEEQLKIMFEVFDENGPRDVNLEDFINGDSRNIDSIRNYIENNRTVIDYCLKGASLNNCQWTNEDVALNDPFPVNSMFANAKIMEATKLIISDSLIKAKEGDIGSAYQNLSLTFDIMEDYNRRAKSCYSWNNGCMFDLVSKGIIQVVPHLKERRAYLLGLDGRLKRYSLQMKRAEIIFDNETIATTKVMSSPSFQGFGASAVRFYLQQAFQNMSSSVRIKQDDLIIAEPDPIKRLNIYKDHRKILRNMIDVPYYEIHHTFEDSKEEFISEILTFQNEKLNFDLNYITSLSLANYWKESYHDYICTKANISACQAAVTIIMETRNGQLPETLPTSIPNDPFCDKPFDYIKNQNGFIIKSKVVDPALDNIHQWIVKLP